MKRLILSLAAAATLAGALAASATPALAQRWEGGDRHGRFERDDRGARWNRPGRGDRWERDAPRSRIRPGDADRRSDWDEGRHNGYYYNNRWTYGRPPEAYLRAPGYRPGYNAWRRGAYLPDYYSTNVINDYDHYRLRPPPRGYHWVRVNRDFLLVAVATGLIFDIISGD